MLRLNLLLPHAPERVIAELRWEVSAQRTEIARLRRRVAWLEGKPSATMQGRNADGSLRCPYADIPGEAACDYHDMSGCRWTGRGGDSPTPLGGGDIGPEAM